jgi:hypothetical protein
VGQGRTTFFEKKVAKKLLVLGAFGLGLPLIGTLGAD